MVGKCPGCGFSPKTGKTRDFNKHMNLTRDKPCQALLQISRNTEAGPGPRTQAHREGQVFNLPIPDTNLRINGERGFQDLDKEVLWPVRFPDEEHHREVWQKGIQYVKDMFKVDGAEYAFSTWFITSIELDLINIILNAKNEDELAEEVFWQCIFLDYPEDEVNEKIEGSIKYYRAKDKGKIN
ncbi:hypothetical protein Glove_456g38 [Diversispora epigaea]|uniref:Uncharacterized protein n=1 Tax=Diversispora epigaea TaxID=1348612 RepID=A0A397GTV4_9GLOM|nr:hypothetical protein Glove_456g38 [Diversispora epigaea]